MPNVPFLQLLTMISLTLYMWPGRCWMWLGGLSKLQCIPAVQFCSKQGWSLPLQFQVWGTQGDETPGYYTSNSKVLNEGVQANLGCVQLVGTNNEHFPVCLYSYSLRGTKLARTKSLLPSQAKMDLNFTQTRPDQSQACVGHSFHTLLKFT